jgi:hypothetical protein
MRGTSRTIGSETYKDLVEEVLDELLLQWARGQEAVEIGSEELSDEVTAVILVPSPVCRKHL